MNEAEFAVFSELVDHHEDLLDGEDEAERLARDIHEGFEREVDTSFEGWETNEKTLDHIEVVIIDVLVKDHELAELVKTEDFIDNVRDYVVENYE
jgi:type I restriction enzyme R subunit